MHTTLDLLSVSLTIRLRCGNKTFDFNLKFKTMIVFLDTLVRRIQ